MKTITCVNSINWNKNFKIVFILFVLIQNFGYSQNSVQTIIDDMTLPGDAPLHGVPASYGWGDGNASKPPYNIPTKNALGQWMRAMTAWGQVYIPVAGSSATNTRCQIRNPQTYMLKKDGKWYQVQFSVKPEGNAFVEDFVNDARIDAGARDETANGGGLSVIVGVGPWAGHNYHFWPNVDRADVDTNDIVGLFTTCEARLIVSDPTKPDDRSMCKNLLDMAGDWWIDKTANWKPDWTANFGIGNGRCKWVLPYWQSFNFCTLTPAQIIANPPLSITTKVLENTASKNKFTTYPNPFVNQIYFDYEINGSVEVFTVDGKLMYQESGKLNSIDLEKLSDGVYFLKVNNNGGNNFYKIIKSNQNY